MIVLFSFEGDRNTNDVIDWLSYYGCSFRRIDLNKEDYRNISIQKSGKSFDIGLKLSTGEVLNISECPYFFTRGKGFEFQDIKNGANLPDEVFHKYIKQEYETLTNFFYSEINKNTFGCFYNDSHSKLNQIKYATEVGLDIPDFVITNNKKSLVNYIGKESLITKAIENNIGINHDGRLIVQRVQKIDFENIEDIFFPSLFQTEIDKEFEIRVFYLDGKCYAIRFRSASTNIDMRDNYSVSEYEPFSLSKELELKITAFMKKMQLVSGSLDFIKSTNGIYYFLEVNPNGQYDWVSQYGGYNLHEKIARFLISKVK